MAGGDARDVRTGDGARGSTVAGRSADRPSDIPKAGWRDVLRRVKAGIGDTRLGVVAAGVAFNEFFALFQGPPRPLGRRGARMADALPPPGGRRPG